MLRTRPARSKRYTEFATSVVQRAGIVDPDVESLLITAFASVPRHEFIASEFHGRIYHDMSLPIGYSQTSSQPSLVARMLGLLCVQPGMRILEIGIGSGYTAAVMAAAGAQVYGVECVGLLAQQTRRRLDALGFQNILIRRRSGFSGWTDHAPYDAILVSTAVPEVPQELIEQLVVPGGALVAPVGTGSTQQLCLVEQCADGPSWFQLEGCCIL